MSSLHPISTTRQYPNVFSPCPVISICTAHVQRLCYLYSTTPDRTPSLQHLYCPYLVSTSYILHISSQNTISHAHILSVHHLFCPFPMRTLPLLAMSSQYIISPALVQSGCHLKLSAHVASEYDLSYPCPLRNGIYIQNIASMGYCLERCSIHGVLSGHEL